MNQKVLYVLIAIVVALLVFVYYVNQLKEGFYIPKKTTETSQTQTNKPAVYQPPAYQPKAKPEKFFVLSPLAGEQWALGEQRTIKWTREAGHSAGTVGGVYLVYANTKEVVGWISQGVAPRQTSQIWNTRDVFLSQTIPVKKSVNTGSYVVRVSFGNNIEAESPPFSILYKDQIQPLTFKVDIKNYLFSPTTLKVRKGSKIIFTNNDSMVLEINLLSYLTKKLQPGESYEVDTLSYVPGTYILTWCSTNQLDFL